jgi:hypothetical protein
MSSDHSDRLMPPRRKGEWALPRVRPLTLSIACEQTLRVAA